MACFDGCHSTAVPQQAAYLLLAGGRQQALHDTQQASHTTQLNTPCASWMGATQGGLCWSCTGTLVRVPEKQARMACKCVAWSSPMIFPPAASLTCNCAMRLSCSCTCACSSFAAAASFSSCRTLAWASLSACCSSALACNAGHGVVPASVWCPKDFRRFVLDRAGRMHPWHTTRSMILLWLLLKVMLLNAVALTSVAGALMTSDVDETERSRPGSFFAVAAAFVFVP